MKRQRKQDKRCIGPAIRKRPPIGVYFPINPVLVSLTYIIPENWSVKLGPNIPCHPVLFVHSYIHQNSRESDLIGSHKIAYIFLKVPSNLKDLKKMLFRDLKLLTASDVPTYVYATFA